MNAKPTHTDNPAADGPALRRVLTFWPLLFYGLGVIVGAGIYVAIGAVIRRAGEAAPLAFLLSGAAAALTGLCYADLAARFPEASGSVAFVRHGFGSNRLAQLTGFALAFAVVIATASITRGAVLYIGVLVPVPPSLLAAGVVGVFTAVAIIGVRESVWLAAAMSIIEIGGLLAATAAGLLAAPEFHFGGMVPSDLAGWRGVMAGAFIAFFAFIGFETMANLAEEVQQPERTIPRGILGAIGASVALYIAVSAAAVLADSGPDGSLVQLFQGRTATVFAGVASIAVANGVLIQIVMLSRLFYGMASKGQLPAFLARVNARTGTPAVATVSVGAIVLAVALLVPFEPLLVLTNAVTLCIFTLVDVALWRLQRRAVADGRRTGIPSWVPPAAATLCVLLLAAEFLS